jgi:hypothetical protein
MANVNLTMSVNNASGGATTPAVGVHSETEGNPVSVTGTPTTGYAFDHWVVSGTGTNGGTFTDNPHSLTMDSAYSMEAFFYPILTIQVNNSNWGSTNPAVGTPSQSSSTSVLAISNVGYQFDHWTVDGVVYFDNPHTVAYDTNPHTIVAFFALAPSGGHGSVSSTPTTSKKLSDEWEEEDVEVRETRLMEEYKPFLDSRQNEPNPNRDRWEEDSRPE